MPRPYFFKNVVFDPFLGGLGDSLTLYSVPIERYPSLNGLHNTNVLDVSWVHLEGILIELYQIGQLAYSDSAFFSLFLVLIGYY